MKQNRYTAPSRYLQHPDPPRPEAHVLYDSMTISGEEIALVADLIQILNIREDYKNKDPETGALIQHLKLNDIESRYLKDSGSGKTNHVDSVANRLIIKIALAQSGEST